MLTDSVLFLTTSNLATNPRLLKEVDLTRSKCRVTVMLFKLGNWSDAVNQKLMAQRPDVNFMVLDATRTSPLSWFTWALAEKAARVVSPLFRRSWLVALGLTRRSFMLLKAARGLKPHALIAGHTLGSLYPAHRLAHRWKCSFGYDAEDYDPGIVVPQAGRNYKGDCELLLKRLLPDARFVTSASPLIGKYTLDLIGGHPNYQVVLNSFPQDEFIPPVDESLNGDPQPLRLVWFSQRMSFGRGLEQLFDALVQICNSNSAVSGKPSAPLFHLTLIGDIDTRFDQQVLQPFITNVLRPGDVGETMGFQSFADSYRSIERIRVETLPPVQQTELHRLLASHDVGLALEVGKDLNNSLAISNKIIAYSQAGLYVLATGTPAQKLFMEEEAGRGEVCDQSAEGIKASLVGMMSRSIAIKEGRTGRFESARALAWEQESRKLEGILGVK